MQMSWTQKRGAVTVEKVLAERSVFMSKAKLVYQAKFTVDNAAREVCFRELLEETDSVLSSDDGDMAGSGFSGGTYSSGGGMAGEIAEQAIRYGKLHTVDFDHAGWREQVKAATEAAGYWFNYGTK